MFEGICKVKDRGVGIKRVQEETGAREKDKSRNSRKNRKSKRRRKRSRSDLSLG